jgi:hypothetical protein
VKTILVDFQERGSFEAHRPIGLWLTTAAGGAEVRYLPEAENEPYDEYLRTMVLAEQWLVAQRRQEPVDWPNVLVRLADRTYLGVSFRSVGHVGDEVSLDEAFRLYVEEGKPLPITGDEEMASGY